VRERVPVVEVADHGDGGGRLFQRKREGDAYRAVAPGPGCLDHDLPLPAIAHIFDLIMPEAGAIVTYFVRDTP
jgi:hypothetical protein